MLDTPHKHRILEINTATSNSLQAIKLNTAINAKLIDIERLKASELKAALEYSQIRIRDLVSYLEKLSEKEKLEKVEELTRVEKEISGTKEILTNLKQLILKKQAKKEEVTHKRLAEEQSVVNIQKKQAEIEKEIKGYKGAFDDLKKKSDEALKLKKDAQEMITAPFVKLTRKEIRKHKDPVLLDVLHAFVSIIREEKDVTNEQIEDILSRDEDLVSAMETIKHTEIKGEKAQIYVEKLLAHEAAFKDKKYYKFTPYYVWAYKICQLIFYGVDIRRNGQQTAEKEDEKKRLQADLNRKKAPEYYLSIENETEQEIRSSEDEAIMLGEILADLERKASNLKLALTKHEEYYFADARIVPIEENILYSDVEVPQHSHTVHDNNLIASNSIINGHEEVKHPEVITKVVTKNRIVAHSEAGKKGVTKGEVAFDDDEGNNSYITKGESQDVVVTTKREEIRTEIQTEDGKGQRTGLFCGFCFR